MRKPMALALAVLSAASASTLATRAQASDESTTPLPVRVEQTATRRVGACTYTVTLRGSYQASPSTRQAAVRVHNAIIDVDTHLDCRGEVPQTTVRQIYFAATTEEQLFARIAEAARAERPLVGGASCSFRPALHHEDRGVSVSAIDTDCPVPERAQQPASASRTRSRSGHR